MDSMIQRVSLALAEADSAVATYDDLARAAIEAMRDPPSELYEALYEAMFIEKYDGTQAPMVGAGVDAFIDAALKETTP